MTTLISSRFTFLENCGVIANKLAIQSDLLSEGLARGVKELSYERTAELVLKCQQRDAQAIAQLLELYGPMAYTVIRNLLYPSPDIDDIYQEACIQAITGIQSIRQPESFGGWFKRIAIRKALDYLRRVVPVTHQEVDRMPVQGDMDDDLVEQSERLAVRQAVASLPKHYKEVVVLYYWSDCSYAEIAEVLKIPQGTVMSRLHKAKRILAINLSATDGKGGEVHGYRD